MNYPTFRMTKKNSRVSSIEKVIFNGEGYLVGIAKGSFVYRYTRGLREENASKVISVSCIKNSNVREQHRVGDEAWGFFRKEVGNTRFMDNVFRFQRVFFRRFQGLLRRLDQYRHGFAKALVRPISRKKVLFRRKECLPVIKRGLD